MEVDSPSIGEWTMEYATGDVQKGAVLLESPLKGMISNSKLHHTIIFGCSRHRHPGEGDSEQHEKKSYREEFHFNPLFIFVIASVIKC